MPAADRDPGSSFWPDPSAATTDRPGAESACPTTWRTLHHKLTGAPRSRPSHMDCGLFLAYSAVHMESSRAGPDGSGCRVAIARDRTSAGWPPHSAHNTLHPLPILDGNAPPAAGTAEPPSTPCCTPDLPARS